MTSGIRTVCKSRDDGGISCVWSVEVIVVFSTIMTVLTAASTPVACIGADALASMLARRTAYRARSGGDGAMG